ncbi:UNVERIFIED_CONTAM: Stromal processing peptidase, chloroplastic, partial [Sesamum indicum]
MWVFYSRETDFSTTGRRYSSQLNELIPQSRLADKCQQVTCFHASKRKQIGVDRFTSGFFVDKSTFHLPRHKLDYANDGFFEARKGMASSEESERNLRKQVRQFDVPHATVGPEEPHAASTAWPDGIMEKEGLDLLESEVERKEFENFLRFELPSHPKLHRGQLKNGLRYLILPNKVPPNRFEAHMEVHVGSIDEEDDEQGMAHMIEHVAFLGSKKHEKLLGTGARSNAYTDFHHTVVHIHSPTSTKETEETELTFFVTVLEGTKLTVNVKMKMVDLPHKDSEGDLFPVVLDALNEIALHPKFLASRVEKERRAILSELQMMNTIEYRVDCQLLQHLHSENKLSKRFPIGLEEQIKKWDADKIRKFHERWYFPANATLYIVGDIDDISKTVNHIEAVFGQTGMESEVAASPTPSAFGAMASFLERLSNSVETSKNFRKERHAIRPPVQHNWSLPGSYTDAKLPQIFQHELLQNFSINMFCKIPVNKVRTYGDLRNVLMKRIFLSALHFRINTRYQSSNPPFTSVELDHSDSGREGCTVTSLTVNAEPQNWQNAIKVAVLEVRRLKEFGVTNGELARYLDALLKDSEQLAAMIDNVSSVDNLDFIMESDALGHTVMDQRQGHDSLVAVAGTVTLEE